MTKLATRIGDRLLGAMLKQHTAGACVANYGNGCGCYGGRWKRIDCNGVCRVTQFACPL
jgi:hypothetical protein